MSTRPHARLAPFLALVAIGALQHRACAEGTVDVHVHLYGAHVAPTEGSATPPKGKPEEGRQPVDYEARAEALVAKMDALGIGKVVMLSPPRGAEGPTRALYPLLQTIASKHAGKLYFLGGGDVLNPLIQGTPRDKVTDAENRAFVKQAEEVLASGAKGFGEMAALHLSMQEGHPFEETLPDHPLFLALAEVAGRHGAVIDLHMDALEEDTEIPASMGRLRSLNPGRLKANVPALEKLLSHDRKARIVWQHAATDPLGGMNPKLLRRLLSSHANLFVALRLLKVEVRPGKGVEVRNALLDDEGNVHADWLALFRDFPDRFMIGSDLFVPKEDVGSGWRPMEAAKEVLEKLPSDLARKIGSENATKVYDLD